LWRSETAIVFTIFVAQRSRFKTIIVAQRSRFKTIIVAQLRCATIMVLKR
jgi:hypothetical protein